MKVLIGAPLRQKPHIFKEHLKSLEALRIPEGVEVDFFWIVNDCPEVIDLLKPHQYMVTDYGDKYETDETEHHWSFAGFGKMSELRTMLTNKALEEGYDYYFSVDTDLVLHPETLAQLLAAEKDLVSEIFWTDGPDGKPWCNSWLWDQYITTVETFEAWKLPGLYEVGMTGALFLISRKVLEAGVNYMPIKNILRAVYGEDRHFCIRAACAGFEIWMDTCYPATHLYRESEYRAYMERGSV